MLQCLSNNTTLLQYPPTARATVIVPFHGLGPLGPFGAVTTLTNNEVLFVLVEPTDIPVTIAAPPPPSLASRSIGASRY
jgi:hypothetical protein